MGQLNYFEYAADDQWCMECGRSIWSGEPLWSVQVSRAGRAGSLVLPTTEEYLIFCDECGKDLDYSAIQIPRRRSMTMTTISTGE